MAVQVCIAIYQFYKFCEVNSLIAHTSRINLV